MTDLKSQLITLCVVLSTLFLAPVVILGGSATAVYILCAITQKCEVKQ